MSRASRELLLRALDLVRDAVVHWNDDESEIRATDKIDAEAIDRRDRLDDLRRLGARF